MPVLNKAKGVYRGSALVAFVRVASRVIWQAKKIVGYTLVAESTLYQNPNYNIYETSSNGSAWLSFQNIEGLAVYFPAAAKYTNVKSMRSSNNGVKFTGETVVSAQAGDVVQLCVPKWG